MHWRCGSCSCFDEMRARLGGIHTPVRRTTRLCIVLVRIASCGAALPVNAVAAKCRARSSNGGAVHALEM